MANWSTPKTKTEICRRGETVVLVERSDQLRGGGRLVCSIPYRRFSCPRTRSSGTYEFKVEEGIKNKENEGICEDCPYC